MGSDKTGACKGGDDKYRCTAFGNVKRPARYRIEVDKYGCWNGQRQRGRKTPKGLPKNLSSCITVTDLLRLND